MNTANLRIHSQQLAYPANRSQDLVRWMGVILLGTLLSGFSLRLSAQSKQDTIIAYFNVFQNIPQEKLYLHLDKPFYGAGEKIWLKGYLVDAMTHQDNARSNFIITELVNRTDSVLQRKKIRRDSLGFQNAFTLPPTIPAGDYYLRGYSNWMLNQAPEYFYCHNLKIGNSIDNTVATSIEYQEAEEGNYVAKIKFLNSSQEPYANIAVKYQYFEAGKSINKGRKKTDEDGRIHLPLTRLKKEAARRIELEFDDPQYICQKTFYLPVFSKDFDVTFFPEGGSLLAIARQNVAFKAQGSDGFSREVTGYLFNAQGDTLSSFRSNHDGMGIFLLTPAYGESYYTSITSSDGITKRFNLPPIEQTGISLSMNHHKQEIRYITQKTASTSWPQELFLVAHTRGKLAILKPIPIEKLTGKLNDSILSQGITHFLLVDGSGKPLSERLIFVSTGNAPEWQIQTDKPSYGKREKVSMQISAQDASGAPLTGNFSISITDSRSVVQDSLTDHILSSLLLTSDLKGYIENPSYYFQKKDMKTSAVLDLLMQTHGWRRHRTDSLLRPYLPNITHYMEGGQTISGRIKGLFGGGIKKGPIYVLSPQSGVLEMTETNDEGEFLVNTSFRDSTTFAIQARTKKGFAGVDILIDKPQYPLSRNKTPFLNIATPQMDNYLQSTREKYYMEGGMQVYNLKEVVVTANRHPVSASENMYVGINDFTMNSDKLSKSGAQTALQVVRALPSVSITNGNEIHIRNNPQQPLIIVDNLTYVDDSSILEIIQTDEIANLSLVKDGNLFGARGAGGAIVITLKDSRSFPVKPARGITTYSPLGYCDPVEFYHPTYDTPQKKENSQSDLRTTLYWNPQLQLDAAGTATLEYYTPDSTAPQDIVIEGIAKNGQVCRFTKTINRE